MTPFQRELREDWDTQMNPRHTSSLIATAFLVAACLVACDDATDSSDRDMATMDVARDAEPGDSSAPDATDSSTATDFTLDMADNGDPFDPCETHADCKRGLVCTTAFTPGGSVRDCSLITGCAQWGGSPDEGCIIHEDGSSSETPAECEIDADCANSPWGPNCIMKVCTEQTPCATSDDCPSGETCRYEQACLPE